MRSMLDLLEISQKVDRMAEIKRQMSELKSESESIEAELLKQFEADVENTKYRTVKYSGETANVTATYADTVKLIYPSVLKTIFGVAYNDLVTEEIKYTLSSSAKKLLAALYKKEYVRDMTVERCLSQIAPDDKTLKVILKKIKGKNFEGDKKNLVKIAKLDEDVASDYAYIIAEAAAWEDFKKLLSVSGDITEERITKVLEYINSAITVEETPKISIVE